MQRKSGKRRQYLIGLPVFFTASLIFVADFFIKDFLRLNHAYESLAVIPGIFHITVIFNKGAAFGIFQGQIPFLIFITLALIGLFVYFIRTEKDYRTLNLIAYGMILGGALSNFYDRIVLGYVVDYLDFRIWPVFNLADSCICIGVGLLILQSFRQSKKDAA